MNLKNLVLLCATVIMLGSCSTPKDLTYMQNLEDNKVCEITAMPSIKIMPEDKLSIVVNSREPLLATMFNLPVVAQRLGSDMISTNS